MHYDHTPREGALAVPRTLATVAAVLALWLGWFPPQIHSQDARAVRLTQAPAQDGNPSWSPDGKRIVFESNRDGNYEIYVIGADGENLKQVTNRPGANVSPVWSPDGSSITYFAFLDGTAEMHVMNPDGTDDETLGAGFRPALSPDGLKIAADIFVADLETHQIYVMGSDGRNRVRLTHTRAYESAPRWSPDGERLVFFSLRDAYPYEALREAQSEIYSMNSDGSNPTKLTKLGAKSKYPRWSPDGSRIAFETDWGGNEDIYVMRADGGALTNVTNHPGRERNAAWSPDGARIVFASDRAGDFDLYILKIPEAQDAIP